MTQWAERKAEPKLNEIISFSEAVAEAVPKLPQGKQLARGFLPCRHDFPEHPVSFDSIWAERARQTGEARLSATVLSESQSLRVINGPGGAAVSAPWCG